MNLAGLELVDTSVQMPLMKLPVRSVIAQLATGRVLLSPASTLTPDALRAAGAITDVVAPSLLHTAGMKAASAAHPTARTWGAAGARTRRPEVRWDADLHADPWPHEAELQRIPLEGMPEFNEVVFLHRASRTLLVTDLVFNITQARGFGPWLILSIFGTYRRFGVSRLFMRSVKDRAAFQRSAARVLSLDFDRLIPSHGEVVETGARDRLAAALRERGISL